MFTTKGRYALRMMIDLAAHKDEGLIPLKDIAERQDVSKKYLEIIAKELVTNGFVESASGKHGGYKLKREPSEYSVGEIIELMEGTFAPVVCLEKGAPKCSRKKGCKTISMWNEFYELEKNFFYEKILSDLL